MQKKHQRSKQQQQQRWRHALRVVTVVSLVRLVSGFNSADVSGLPSAYPSGSPSGIPTGSVYPSENPSEDPSTPPTGRPTGSVYPSEHPTASVLPSGDPSSSTGPSGIPTNVPSGGPSGSPSGTASDGPSENPTTTTTTAIPSSGPSDGPSVSPTGTPSRIPSANPTGLPSGTPSGSPTDQPTELPTELPTVKSALVNPTGVPTKAPSRNPTRAPTEPPSRAPTDPPTENPTGVPTGSPTGAPTKAPTAGPTSSPSESPSGSYFPSSDPTGSPTRSALPSESPSNEPTRFPTNNPTGNPTNNHTNNPTHNPTGAPTDVPTRSPTNDPTGPPTRNPTREPTRNPTENPSGAPSDSPTATFSPTSTFSPTTTFPPTTFSPTSGTTSSGTINAPSSNGGATADNNISPQSISTTDNLSCVTAVPFPPIPTDSRSDSSATEGIIRSLPLVGLNGPCLSGFETVGGWYQIAGTGNVFTLTACSLNISRNVGISVFSGDCSRLECIEHHQQQAPDCEIGNGYAVSFASKPGTVYHVLVSGLPVGTDLSNTVSSEVSLERRFFDDSFDVRRLRADLGNNSFRLELTETDAPLNSKCGTALPVTYGSAVDGSTVGLLTTYKTCHGEEKSGAWYTIEGKQQAERSPVVYEANTCNQESNFYNTISIYRGDRCGSHECVEFDVLDCPDGSLGQQVFWKATRAEDYQIFVHSSDEIEASLFNAGSFRLDVSWTYRLENDQCGTAVETRLNRPMAGTTAGAKPDIASTTGSSCGTGGAGAWYRITGTGGVFQATTCSTQTDHDTRIQIYSGDCGTLECMGSLGGNNLICDGNKASIETFQTEVGVDYYILVSSRDTNTGNFGLKVTEIQPEANNMCETAQSFTEGVDLPNTAGDTTDATNDFLPGYGCGVPIETSGVWYEVEGTGTGMTYSTSSSECMNTAISVFKGSCDGLECVTGSSSIRSGSECPSEGAETSFFGERDTKYYVYVHGGLDSSSGSSVVNVGSFSLSSSKFDVQAANEFCSSADSVPTDGGPIRGSTRNVTQASVPFSTCGPPIKTPGLWYTFEGNGNPFEISACGSGGVSVSVFSGGPTTDEDGGDGDGGGGGCESLTCLTGTSFGENACASAPGRHRRGLQARSSSAFRVMTEVRQNYYVFVHGTDGVGDFDLFVRDEMIGSRNEALTSYPTATEPPMLGSRNDVPTIYPTTTTEPPTSEDQLRQGEDMRRTIPMNMETMIIVTEYEELDIVEPPVGGVTTEGSILYYSPPLDFIGKDVMTVDGCNGIKCYRFNVTIYIEDDGEDLTRASDDDSGRDNRLWWLLLLIPFCVCLPVYLLCFRNKDREEARDNFSENNDYGESEAFMFRDEENGASNYQAPRGITDSNIVDDDDKEEKDWESIDYDDDSRPSDARSGDIYGFSDLDNTQDLDSTRDLDSTPGFSDIGTNDDIDSLDEESGSSSSSPLPVVEEDDSSTEDGSESQDINESSDSSVEDNADDDDDESSSESNNEDQFRDESSGSSGNENDDDDDNDDGSRGSGADSDDDDDGSSASNSGDDEDEESNDGFRDGFQGDKDSNDGFQNEYEQKPDKS